MPAHNVIELKGTREAPRSQRSSMETLIVSLEQVDQWLMPPFQRPKTINAKVQLVARNLIDDPVIQGVITLGRLRNSTALYIVDGQHRIAAFKMSGLPEVIVDVRIVTFDSMAEMAKEFEELNTALARMRPDDILRAKEGSSEAMQRLRNECPYVGYDNIRRSSAANAPVVSMSMLFRCWDASTRDTPSPTSTRTAAALCMEMDKTATDQLVRFLHSAYDAWGREPEYFRLWGSLNMAMLMWLYRRLVIDRERRGNTRYMVLSDAQFRQCMMSLSADSRYLDWLQGRLLAERDRSPCYNQIKTIFVRRLVAEGVAKPIFPAPAWLSSTPSARRF